MTNALGEDNWQYIIDFAVDLVNSINVGDDETHVAAVSFGKQLLQLTNACCSYLKRNIDLHCFLQCFDAVGWAAGRASGLQKTEWWDVGVVVWDEVQT